jgi:N-acetylglucosamine kinase-like BadF-type ATPase
MQIKGATTVLEKQCKFLGMKWDDLIEFIERAPLAQTQLTIKAYKVYKRDRGY